MSRQQQQLIGPYNTPLISPAETAQFDSILTALAERSNGDLRKMLTGFFSFLHRRTDFYMLVDESAAASNTTTTTHRSMGFKEGDAERILLATFRQFPLRKMKSSVASNNKKHTSSVTTTKGNFNNKSDSEKSSEQSAVSSVGQVKDEHSLQAAMSSSSSKATTTTTSSSNNSSPKNKITVRYTEEGKQIPIGNGGITSKYSWTQTLDEINVVFPLDSSIVWRAKMLDVDISTQSLSVCNKATGEKLLVGKLSHKVSREESTWTMEGGVLLLSLDKVKPSTWWETVLDGDEIIDTSMVDSTRRIREYDESTQAAIRKVIHEQSLTRGGGNTSLPPGVEYIDSNTDLAKK